MMRRIPRAGVRYVAHFGPALTRAVTGPSPHIPPACPARRVWVKTLALSNADARRARRSIMPVEPYLSLVVPAYNEAASIARTLDLMRAYLERRQPSWEIIVSADGTDGTRERAREFSGTDQRIS